MGTLTTRPTPHMGEPLGAVLFSDVVIPLFNAMSQCHPALAPPFMRVRVREGLGGQRAHWKQSQTATTAEAPVGRKATNLASLALYGSRPNSLSHMLIMKMAKQKRKQINQWTDSSAWEGLPVCSLAVESYRGEKIGVPLSDPQWSTVTKIRKEESPW